MKWLQAQTLSVTFLRALLISLVDALGHTSPKIARARKEALEELQQQAKRLGANAVVGVEVNYTSINGEGKSMFMIVASGTAVVVR